MDLGLLLSIAAVVIALGSLFVNGGSKCDELEERLNQVIHQSNEMNNRQIMLEETLGYQIETGTRLVKVQ